MYVPICRYRIYFWGYRKKLSLFYVDFLFKGIQENLSNNDLEMQSNYMANIFFNFILNIFPFYGINFSSDFLISNLTAIMETDTFSQWCDFRT